MPALPAVLEMLQKQADIGLTREQVADTAAQTEQRKVVTAQAQQTLETQRTLQTLLQQGMASGDIAAKDTGVSAIDTVDGFTPIDPKSPIAGTIKGLKDRERAVGQLEYVARAAGDLDSALKASKQRDDLQKEERETVKDYMADQQRIHKEAAQTIATVDSPAGLRAAVRYVRASLGQEAAQKLATQIAQQIPDLDKATPEEIQKAVKPIAMQYATVGEQLRAKSTDQAAKDRAANLADRARHEEVTEVQGAARVGIAREGLGVKRDELALRRTLADDTRGRRDDKETAKVAVDEQKRIDKAETTEHFSAIKKSYSSAQNTLNVLRANGFEGITPAEANSVLSEYSQITNNYKSLVGGKWSLQQRKEFDSKIAQVSSYLRSIGQGKKYTPATLENAAAEIDRMYNGANAELVKRTLQSKEKVYHRGGDPREITTSASLDQALKSGAAKMTTTEEGKVVMFGPNKDDWFLLRDKPKQGTRAALLDEDE